MSTGIDAKRFVEKLKTYQSAEELKKYHRYFKFDEGKSGKKDDQDLIHKATGWALRYAGDKDRQRLLSFLDKHAATMPRVALRYAIEHFDKKQRDHYLSLKKVG